MPDTLRVAKSVPTARTASIQFLPGLYRVPNRPTALLGAGHGVGRVPAGASEAVLRLPHKESNRRKLGVRNPATVATARGHGNHLRSGYMHEGTTVESRLLAGRQESPDGCWLWSGCRCPAGYGMMSHNGTPKMTHRLAFELWCGPIPVGMQIDHVCHVRACFNPSHLRLATHKQNSENVVGSRRTSASGIRGVRQRKSGWQVTVVHNGVDFCGGTYRDIADAEAAAIALRVSLFTHNDADRTGVNFGTPS